MAWTVNAFSIGLLASASVATLVGLATLRERPDPLAWPLTMFMAAVGTWSLVHGLSFGFSDPDRVEFWIRAAGPAGTLTPVAFLIVALRYADEEKWLPSWTDAALAAPAVALGLVVWTNPYHGLFWSSTDVEQVYGASVLTTQAGSLHWLVFAYGWLATAVALLVFARVVVRSGPIYRKQATLMFLGGLLPLATNVAFQFGLLPLPAIDLTSTMLAASGLTFALVLFHFDLMDVRPVAHERLVESLDDAIVVLGPDDEVRDFNPTAERLLGDLALHRPAEAVLPAAATQDGGELVLHDDDEERTFRTRTTPLEDATGNSVGRICYLNDVTEIVEREQRVSVLNRVLRHNIRNELTIAMGNLELLSESASDTERVATINESIKRVVQFAEKARSIEQTLREEDSSSVVEVEQVAERVVDAAQRRFPSARVTVSPGTDALASRSTVVRVVDEDLLARSLWELVENAVVHNDADRPRISIDVDPGPDRVRIHVTDNGPGIPSDEREILQVQPESSLEHGSGLGLWLVQWTTSLSSGEVLFDVDDAENTVTLVLPAVEDDAVASAEEGTSARASTDGGSSDGGPPGAG